MEDRGYFVRFAKQTQVCVSPGIKSHCWCLRARKSSIAGRFNHLSHQGSPKSHSPLPGTEREKRLQMKTYVLILGRKE